METQQYVYQTYVPRIPLFMSGHTEHIPNTEEEEYINRIIRIKEIPRIHRISSINICRK